MVLQQLHEALPDHAGSTQDSDWDFRLHKSYLEFYNSGYDTRRLLRGADFGPKRVFVERTEAFLLGIESPTAPHDTQAGHDWDGKIDSKHSGDFSAGQHAKNSRQWMQFQASSHNAGRNHVILDQAPRGEEDQ